MASATGLFKALASVVLKLRKLNNHPICFISAQIHVNQFHLVILEALVSVILKLRKLNNHPNQFHLDSNSCKSILSCITRHPAGILSLVFSHKCNTQQKLYM